eukprot:359004-Chlamydomonas_euryale.AAC.1
MCCDVCVLKQCEGGMDGGTFEWWVVVLSMSVGVVQVQEEFHGAHPCAGPRHVPFPSRDRVTSEEAQQLDHVQTSVEAQQPDHVGRHTFGPRLGTAEIGGQFTPTCTNGLNTISSRDRMPSTVHTPVWCQAPFTSQCGAKHRSHPSVVPSTVHTPVWCQAPFTPQCGAKHRSHPSV